MNYACVYTVAVLLFALVYWWIRGRVVYNGPVTEAIADDLSEREIVAAEKADKGPAA
jgi:hypothetical protein